MTPEQRYLFDLHGYLLVPEATGTVELDVPLVGRDHRAARVHVLDTVLHAAAVEVRDRAVVPAQRVRLRVVADAVRPPHLDALAD